MVTLTESPTSMLDLFTFTETDPSGFDMARAAGTAFVAAGWANDIPQIEAFMRANSEVYCKTVAALAAFLEG